MKFPRASGILLHPTSLPGEFGIGDLGPKAYEFVDFLARTVQTYWQILPLTPTGYGDSPYSSYSAFAGNTLLISPEKLVDDGFLIPEDIESRPDFPTDRVDYGWVIDWKRGMLAKAFEAFRSDNNSKIHSEFETFTQENSWWLDDFSLYLSLKQKLGHGPWLDWETRLKLRDPEALNAARSELHGTIEAENFCQFLFFRQWRSVKEYANRNGVKIIGDVPIFVALDSADVWCNQDKFKLDENGAPVVVSGVPPDYFSSTGQRWGNPIYDWDAMREGGFGWWAARLGFALKTVDVVRLDHFIGFAHMWEVPSADETAENGQWVDVPGGEIFTALTGALGDLPFIAEDLGSVTPEVEKLRDDFSLPGMRILQYGFGGDPGDHHVPHNYVQNCVAYIGTHDNETAAGWYRSTGNDQRRFCRKYLGATGREMHWEMVRAVMTSVADTAIVPMQDILGLGNEARMNVPAGRGPNWQWRFKEGDVSDEAATRLREMTEIYGRRR